MKTNRNRPKSAPYLRLKIAKGLQSLQVLQHTKKLSEKSLTMLKKTERGDPLGFFNIHSIAKFQKKIEGGHFGNFFIETKSRNAENKLKGGPFSLVRYCMLRGKPF